METEKLAKTKINGHTVGADRPFKNVNIKRALSEDEKDDLEECVARFRAARTAHYDMGDAARTIRDNKLWRGKYRSFEECCRPLLDYPLRNVERLMAFVAIVDDVRPIGRVPTHESQVRCLTKLDAEQRKQVWASALDHSKDPTAPTAFEVVSEGRKLGFFKKRKPPTPSEVSAERAAGILTDYILSRSGKGHPDKKKWLQILFPIADYYHVLRTLKPKDKKHSARRRKGGRNGK